MRRRPVGRQLSRYLPLRGSNGPTREARRLGNHAQYTGGERLWPNRRRDPQPASELLGCLLWRRLMGEIVLDAGPMKPGLHIYAHCRRGRRRGVAIVAINLDQIRPATLALPFPAARYTLTADYLQSETVKLNGTPIALAGDALPTIRGVKARAGHFILSPASINFLAVPAASNRACR